MDVSVRLGDYLCRPLTASEADTAFILNLRNSAAAQAAFFTTSITRDDHLRFLRAAQDRDEINWIVEKLGEAVGTGGIYRIDRKNGHAEFGRLVAMSADVHLATAFVAMNVVFEHLGLHKLVADALETNTVSNRMGERIGFVREGLLREHVLKDGVRRDVVLFGMLAADWQRAKLALGKQFGEPRIIRHAEVAAW